MPPPVPTPTPPIGAPPATQPPPNGTPTPHPYAPNPPAGGAPTDPDLVGARSITVPVAGHVTGVGGILFLTDLQIENPTQSGINGRLTFLPSGSGSPTQVTLALAPSQTLNYFDVVGNRFGIFNSAGALKLEADGVPVASLRMTSRTYARSGEGTFGQAVSGVPERDGATGSRFVTGLVCSPGMRSNVGLVNTSSTTQRVRILLYAASGAHVGTTDPVSLTAGTQAQWSLRDIFGVEGHGLSVEFRPEPGSFVPTAYAALIDNVSGDPTYYPAMQPQSLFYLPGVARVTGIGFNQFSSDVSVTNTSEVPAAVTVMFLEKERDNSSSNPTVSFSLAPRETRQMDDALGLFGLSETYGALRVESSGPGLVVAGRIFTDSTTTAGTVGQQADPIGPNGWFRRGSILGLRQDQAYRSNVGLLNPEGRPVTVSLWLKLQQGMVIGHTTITVAPHSYLQRNLTVMFPGVSLPAGQVMTVTVDADSPIFPFATVVDNVTQDLTFSPGLK